jgi:PEGA domain
MTLRDRGRKQRATLVGIALAVGTLGGCVERRYTIRTDPPGALVIANGEEIGPSPVSRSFVFYDDRDITLMLDGYQTQRIIQPIKAPWWDSLPLEFFTENLIPITFRDEREFNYKLVPVTNPPQGELLERAEGLRVQGQTTPPPRRGGILGFFGF